MSGTHVKFIFCKEFIEEEVYEVCDAKGLRSMGTGHVSFHR
jgi:hypothetical protein